MRIPSGRVSSCSARARRVVLSNRFHFPTSALAFTADSLMAMGCGRLFEGTPAQMWDSLQKLMKLPPETLICSGHEYTASNMRFALGP